MHLLCHEHGPGFDRKLPLTKEWFRTSFSITYARSCATIWLDRLIFPALISSRLEIVFHELSGTTFPERLNFLWVDS
jgi:hypothetical protein